MPLMSQRHLFSLPEDIAFLNCANMSPQLKSVAEAGIKAVNRKAEPWRLRSEDWFSGAERLRHLAGQIMGAPGENMAIVPSASYGIAVAGGNVAVEPGQAIIVLDEQYPSNVYAWRVLARERAATLRTVARRGAASWTEPVLDAIDASVAVVAVPNCHWTDGRIVDLIAVSKRAREVGAALVVDASQSLGAKPFDVKKIRPDFVVSVGYKWLMGPYGLGYLYAAPEYHHSGRPLEQSWLTRNGAEDFTRLVEYTDDFRPGARRFDMGEFPQFVLGPMAEAALEQILEWGVENIEAALAGFTDLIGERVTPFGADAIEPQHRVAHMTGVRLPNGPTSGLSAALRAKNIFVSIRGDAVRVSPHLYNSQQDILRFVEVLSAHV